MHKAPYFLDCNGRDPMHEAEAPCKLHLTYVPFDVACESALLGGKPKKGGSGSSRNGLMLSFSQSLTSGIGTTPHT